VTAKENDQTRYNVERCCPYVDLFIFLALRPDQGNDQQSERDQLGMIDTFEYPGVPQPVDNPVNKLRCESPTFKSGVAKEIEMK